MLVLAGWLVAGAAGANEAPPTTSGVREPSSIQLLIGGLALRSNNSAHPLSALNFGYVPPREPVELSNGADLPDALPLRCADLIKFCQ